MPVRVIMNDRTALLGAARYAALHPPDPQPDRGARPRS